MTLTPLSRFWICQKNEQTQVLKKTKDNYLNY